MTTSVGLSRMTVTTCQPCRSAMACNSISWFFGGLALAVRGPDVKGNALRHRRFALIGDISKSLYEQKLREMRKLIRTAIHAVGWVFAKRY